MVLVSIWSKSSDKLLADLCHRILNRRLLKGFEVASTDLTDLIERIARLEEKAVEVMGNHDTLIMLDNPSTKSI